MLPDKHHNPKENNMSDVDFNSILDTQAEDIKSRPPLPVGSYNFVIKKLDHVTSSQKKTPGIEFTVAPVEARDDVDQELLQEAGGLDRELTHTFWITPDAASMVRDFLRDHVGIESSGKSLRQMLAESIGQTFGGIVTHGTSKAGRPYAQIDQTFRIE